MTANQKFLDSNKLFIQDFVIVRNDFGEMVFYSALNEDLPKIDLKSYSLGGGSLGLFPELIKHSDLQYLKEVLNNGQNQIF